MGKIRTITILLATILISALPAQAQRSSEVSHIVQPGETLGHIAQQYDVSVYQLAALNEIGNAQLIFTWQQLAIPSESAQAESAQSADGRHRVQRGETLDSIAKLYEVNLFELQRANNIFNEWIFPGDVLMLPGQDADLEATIVHEDSTEPTAEDTSPTISGETHIVLWGETLATIAAQYGVSIFDLQVLNDNFDGWLYAGEELLLPATDSDTAPAVIDLTTETNIPAPDASEFTHVVQFGETLGTISVAYGVSLFDLQALNDAWSYLIYPGQELAIPAGGTPPETESTAPVEAPLPHAPVTVAQPSTHTVQPGETLFGIATQYNLPVDLLMSANGIADPRRVHSGLVLRITDLESAAPPQQSAATGSTPTSPSTSVTREQYVVLPGEFLSTIGSKLGINWLAIAEINGISNPDALYAGAVLQVPTREEAARYGPVRPVRLDPGAYIGVGRELVVVLSTQTAYAYENGILQKSSIISSGLPDTPTIQGDFKITRKTPSRHMVGPDYDLPGVPWVSYFFAGYAFHGTYWHNNFGTPMSHGCVNMTTADAKWFYDFAPVGTPVHVRY